MHLLLFIVYAAILSYAITRMPFFRNSGIKPLVLILLFALRVATGCLHNLIAWRYFPHHGDIWGFFNESIVTRHELFTDFHLFIRDNSAWFYLPYNTIGFMHLLFNFLSFDNLYINTLFFSFFVFWGSIAMFRAFRGFFDNHLLTAATVFLIPSTLFWTACVHKDGMIFLLLGFFFYQIHRARASTMTHTSTSNSIFLSCLFFLLAVFFRGNLIVTLLPALMIWWCCRLRVGILASLPAVIVVVFLVWPATLTATLQYIVSRQNEFQILQGNSRIPLPVLLPTLSSFIHTLPTALLNGFFEPLPGSGGQAIYLVFSWELLLIWAISLLALIYTIRVRAASRNISSSRDISSGRDSPPSRDNSRGFIICSLFFAFSGMLLIGFTIPFVGAIVRYRSIYLPFLLAPAIFVLRDHPILNRLNHRLTALSTINYNYST